MLKLFENDLFKNDFCEIIDLYFNKSIKLQSGDPVNFHFKENKKIVIFELESTLVSCFWGNVPNEINNTLGINVRPHLKSSLDLMAKFAKITFYQYNRENTFISFMNLYNSHNFSIISNESCFASSD